LIVDIVKYPTIKLKTSVKIFAHQMPLSP